MTHLDDSTLQSLFDGELSEPGRAAASRHLADCADCSARRGALDAMRDAVSLWADGVPDLGDVTAAVMARVAETPKSLDVKASNDVAPGARVIPLRRAFSGRAALLPAMVAAAALLVWKIAPKTPDLGHPDSVLVIPHVEAPPADSEPRPVVAGTGDGPSGTEVTGVDLQGVVSYTVMEIAGMNPGVTTTVVWIQDGDEGSGILTQPQ